MSLWPANSPAQTVCKLTEASFDKKIRINEIPGFFFKVHPSGDLLSYIGEDANMILDLNTGKGYKTSSRGDPVWFPDGKFISVINNNIDIYDGDQYISTAKNGKPENAVAHEIGLGGTYQSIGKTKTGYKMISDQDGISIASLNTDGKMVSEVTRPCSNIKDLPTDLPMLSKDGRYFSVHDPKSKSTKIYHLENEHCSLALDLGFSTGKVSFNMDSTQIAFHLDQFVQEEEDGYFSGVAKDKVKNVVIVNLESSEAGKKLNPSTWALASGHINLGNGGYYPDFDGKKNLYYMEDVGNNFQFVKVHPSKLEFRNYNKNDFDHEDCVNCETATIAKIWDDLCSKIQPLSMLHERSLIAALDPKQCKKMIEDSWTPSLGQSKEDLLKLCPALPRSQGSIVGTWDGSRVKNGQDILHARCVSCHSVQMEYEIEKEIRVNHGDKVTTKIVKVKNTLPAFKKDETDLYTLARMKIALETGRMPKGGGLPGNESSLLAKYLYGALLDVPRELQRYVDSHGTQWEFAEPYLSEEINRRLSELPQNASESKKQEITREVRCMTGRQECPSYIEFKRKDFEIEANKLPPERRTKYVEKKVMQIRCDVYVDITFDECLKWKFSN